jgi:hypothetical protein
MNNYTSLFTMEHVYKQPPQGIVAKTANAVWSFLFLALISLFATGISAQTVLVDDFNRANSNTVGNSWSEIETAVSGAQIASNVLQLGSTTAGREFVYQDLSALSSPIITDGITNNTATITWAFNFRTNRSNPSGFDNGNYGLAFVLCKSTTPTSTGVGYAVTVGGSATNDPIKLTRFSGGGDLNSEYTDIVAAGTSSGIGNNNFISVRVTYNPVNDEWSLYAEANSSAFPQSDPRNTTNLIGSAVNTTYTATGNNLRYFGPNWNHSTGAVASNNGIFDDIYAPTGAVTYTVTYDGNTNTAGTEPTDSNNYEEDDDVTVLGAGTLAKTGYNFNNWNTAADGSGTTYAPSATFSMPAANVVLYAQWTLSASPFLTAGLLTGFGDVCVNATSAEQSFTLSGANLDGSNVSISGDVAYEFATSSGGTFSNPLVLLAYDGTTPGTIYVRFTPTAATSYNGNIAVSGGGASSVNVAVSGSGSNGTVAVTTTAASGFTTTGASSGGSAVSTTCGTITAKGVVWATSANPTVPSANSTNDGTGTASYSSIIAGLTSNTVYNYRAYATNSNAVTSYGSNQTFTTVSLPATAPDANTATSSSFTATWSAPTGQGSASLTYTVEVYSDNTFTTMVGSPVTGINTTSTVIGSLSPLTTYYYRVKVVNAGGDSDWVNYTTGITTLEGPCLSTDFPTSSLPAGWGGTSANATTSAHYQSPPNTRGLGSGVTLITAPVDNPVSITFYVDASGSGGQIGTLAYSVANGAYTNIGTFTASTAGNTETFDLTSSPNLTALQEVRFRITSGANTIYIDDLSVYCNTTPAPAIAVKQSTTDILSGTGSYSFGNQQVSTTSAPVIFSIYNTGNADLVLDSITLSGAGANQFILAGPASSNVLQAGNTTFTVAFAPTSTGNKSATVTIYNNTGTPYTFTVTGNGVYSTSSDIVEVSGFTYTSNIPYLSYQNAPTSNTTGNVGVFQFQVRDGGGANDSDALPTTLNEITFAYTGTANTVAAAGLFQGNTHVADGTVDANTISFTGLNIAAADNNVSANYTLRVSFGTIATDNEQLQFTVQSAVAAGTGSSFSAANAGAATSSTTGDRNRLEVVANHISFLQQPVNTSVDMNMSPNPTVQAVDVNNNRDLDFTGSISITSSGALAASPQTATATLGVATFNNINHTAAGPGFVLTANSSLGNAVSNPFDITTIVYTNGDYRTLGSSTWISNVVSSNWERLVSGVWTPSNSPSYNSTNTIFIQNGHTVTTGGSWGSVDQKIRIMDGGMLTVGHAGTVMNMTVHSGAVLNVNGALTISGGNLEIENNATLNYNHTGSTSTSLFAGTEIFHPNSNFVVKGISNVSNTIVNTNLTTSTFDGHSALFGNFIIDIASPAGNTDLFPGTATTYNLTHQDFIVRNFGSNSFRFATTGSITFNVGRNFIVESTVAAPVQFKTSGSLVMNIAGDMLLQGGNTRLMATSNAGATTTVNLEGNLVMTGNALLEYNNTSTGNQVDVTLNIKGDVDVAATALVRSSNGNGSNYGFFNFVGTGDGLTEATTQTVSIATTVANENGNIRFTVANGAYVRLAGQNLDLGPRGSMNVSTGGTLDFGFNGTTALNVYGVGQTGSTFTSQWGLNVAMSGMMGNVSTNTIPTVNTLATFHYIGKENQMTGDVIVNSTLTSNGKIVIVELENNSFTLTPSSFGYIGISNGTALDTQGGRMEIRKGIFLETPNVQVAGSGRLVMTDGTFRTSVLETQLPQLSNHANYSLTGGTVELNGSGNQILKGSPAGGYYNVAVTNAGNKTISSGFSIANNLLITDGVLDVGTVTVNGAGGLTMTGGRFRLGRLSASLPELAGTATPYNLTGGTVELYGTSSTQTHSLRGTYGSPSANISYYNVELTSVGGNVGAGGANVVASAGFGVQGTMTVFAPTCFQLAYNLTITGTGTFDLQADAALKYGGTITASGNTGNIRTAVRNFPTTASYGFVGFVNAQQAGDGLPAQVVNLYLDKNVYNQQVQTANNVSVTGTLRFYNGVVNTGENKVTIEQGGSVVGAGISNGWVHGTLEKFIATSATTANYEVGFSGYSPVSVGLQSVTEGGYMSWRARTLDHPQLATSGILNPDKSINRYWTVGLNDISLTSYSPTFTFLNGDKDAGINTAGVGIGLYNGSWNVMYVGTRAANSTQALNAMLIGDFAIAEAFDMVIPPANDNAQSNNPNFNLGTYVYPSCINVQGTTTNATVHPATGKRDVWYQFVAKSNGVTIRVSSSVIDPRIYLFDANNLSTPLDVEDLIVGTGAEVLNYGNLVEGQSYRIAVASNSANDGIFNICVGHLRIPTCNVTAERTLCELLHTGVTGAHSTVFNFTDVATSATSSYTSSTNNMTLSSPSAQLRHGATYAISNTAIYNLQNGLGTTETISVSNGGGCTLVIAPHRLLEVKANQRCANSAVLTRAANLNADYFGAGGMCGHNGFVVEFTPVANCAGDDPQVLDAFTKSVSVTTPYISLNYAFNHLPLAENSAIGYWSVRWKPRYATYQGVFGPAHVIAVNGTAPAPAFATAPAQEPISAVEVAGGNISSNIYPNPNNGDVMNINLTGVTSSEVFVRIMDSMGREVYTNRYSVDGSLNTMVSFSKPLAQGVYMVEFTAGTEVITQRMMVTK